MKRLILLILLSALLLTGCRGEAGNLQKAAYQKITPQEAQSRMDSSSAVLDVRTQAEFDEGHIQNALLLPDNEIADKAEAVLTDKDQSIFVYCRSGNRSKSAAKALIAMGYTKVYDFGGISDWPGEIVGNSLYSSYYNYFGGDLPPAVVSPIDFSMSKKIHEQMPEFTFHLTGINTQTYLVASDERKYYLAENKNNIDSITVTNANGAFQQVLSGLSTDNTASAEALYGFFLDDWNFDGYLDMSLWKYPGGTLSNSPHYYWLWDPTLRQFTENEILGDLSKMSSLDIDREQKLITSFQRAGAEAQGTGYYSYKNGRYILIKSEEITYEPIDGEENRYQKHTVVRTLVNGKMQITKDFYEEVLPD